MKRIIFSAFIFAFLLGVVAVSADSGCGMSAKKACASAGKKSCCAKKGSAGKTADKSCTKTASNEAKNLVGEKGHECPDVSSKAALNGFHESLEPMHAAYKERNFDSIREKLPSLIKASKSVADYKCAGYDKCSDACRSNFDGKKAELIESVEKLKIACKGNDNEIVAASFDAMHEAYIEFANTCSSH